MQTIAMTDPKPSDTIPAPPYVGARRDAAVLALHLARTRVDDLTFELARRAGVDTGVRRMIEVLSCLGPVLTAIESLIPEAGEARELPADGPFAECRCGRTHTRQGWGQMTYVGPLDDGKDVLEMRRCWREAVIPREERGAEAGRTNDIETLF
jgi:hypothetical protein